MRVSIAFAVAIAPIILFGHGVAAQLPVDGMLEKEVPYCASSN
jgi:hypothetical protein